MYIVNGNRCLWLFFAFVCLLAYCSVAIADDTKDSFEAGHYQSFCLDFVDNGEKITIENRHTFLMATKIAVSLQKANLWNTDTENRILDILNTKNITVCRYVLVLKQLLSDDTKAVLLFFNGDPPSVSSVQDTIAIYRNHGFPVVADTLAAVFGNWFGKKTTDTIIAWLSVPADKRAPVDTAMEDQIAKQTRLRELVALAAYGLYLNPPENPPRAFPPLADFLSLAIKYGNTRQVLTLSNAQRLLGKGDITAATQILFAIAKAEEKDPFEQLDCASFAHLRLKDEQSALTIYENAMRTVPEPYLFLVRRSYASYRKSLAEQEKAALLAAFAEPADALYVADALFVAKQRERAIDQYLSVFNDPTQPVAKRFDALSGILDCDPRKAVDLAGALICKLPVESTQERSDLIAWFGWRLWDVGRSVITPSQTNTSLADDDRAKPSTTGQEWCKSVTALYDQLWTLDKVASLTPTHLRSYLSSRYPATVFNVVARQPKHAVETLFAHVEFQVASKDWDDGMGHIVHMQSYRGVYPLKNEVVKTVQEVFTVISACPQPDQTVPPFCEALLAELKERLQHAKSDDELKEAVQMLAMAIKYDVAVLDPLPKNLRIGQAPPPSNAVDFSRFANLISLVNEAMAEEKTSKYAGTVLNDGLTPALLTASHPKVLEQLIVLAGNTLDQIARTEKDKNVTAMYLNSLTNLLAKRPVYDMSAYIQTLRDRYLQN